MTDNPLCKMPTRGGQNDGKPCSKMPTLIYYKPNHLEENDSEPLMRAGKPARKYPPGSSTLTEPTQTLL